MFKFFASISRVLRPFSVKILFLFSRVFREYFASVCCFREYFASILPQIYANLCNYQQIFPEKFIKKGCQLSLTTLLSAERVGFEPTVPFWSTHTFQACSFDHSDISPDRNSLQTYWPPKIHAQKQEIFLFYNQLFPKLKSKYRYFNQSF